MYIVWFANEFGRFIVSHVLKSFPPRTATNLNILLRATPVEVRYDLRYIALSIRN